MSQKPPARTRLALLAIVVVAGVISTCLCLCIVVAIIPSPSSRNTTSATQTPAARTTEKATENVSSATDTPSTATPTPIPATSTPLPSPTSTPTSVPLIVDALAIIDLPVKDAEKILGKASEAYSYNANEIEELPNGGQIKDYKIDKYLVSVSYYKSIAVGIQIMEGLDSDAYTLNDWQTVLARVGVVDIRPPDRTAPAGLHWDNYQGYAMWMVTDSIGGSVWTVKVYRLTK